MGPNNAHVVRVFPRKTNNVIADLAFPSDAAFEAVVECEAGKAIHGTGAKYEITIDVIDFSSMVSVIRSGIVAAGHLHDPNWPTQAMQFVFPIAAPGTYRENHIWKIFASLKIGVTMWESKKEIKDVEPEPNSENYLRLKSDRVKPILNTFAGGFIGLCIFILQSFLSAGNLNIPATISVCAISIAIPMLAGLVAVVNFSKNVNFYDNDTVYNLFRISFLSSIVGVACAICSISWVACCLFVLSVVITFIFTNDLILI